MFRKTAAPDNYEERQTYWQEKLKYMSSAMPQGLRFDENASPAANTMYFKFNKKIVPSQTNAEHFLLTAFIALLHLHSNEFSITVGAQVNAEPCVPIRLDFSNRTSFAEMQNDIARTSREAQDNHIPLHVIYALLPKEIKSSLKSAKLPFDIMVRINQAVVEADAEIMQPGLLNVAINTHADELELVVQYSGEWFRAWQIDSLIAHYGKVLIAAAENPDILPGNIPIATDAELEDIQSYNDTDRERFYKNIGVAEVMSLLPEDVMQRDALVFHPENAEQPVRWSHEKLHQYSTQVAHYLRGQAGFKEGEEIVVSIRRSPELFGIILGILKAGLVFKPLETVRTTVFLDKLKKTNKAAAYLVDDQTKPLFEGRNNCININDAEVRQCIAKASTLDKLFFTYADDKDAYVMYSSGTSSSGGRKKPKLTHGNINYILNGLHHLKFADALKLVGTAPANFDASLYDLFLMLVTKGTLHVNSDEERLSSDKIDGIIRSEQIDFAAFLPAFMSKLPPDTPLKRTIIMGQAARSNTFDDIGKANPGNQLEIGFGPTECGICTHSRPHKNGSPLSWIGKPLAGMKVAILNPHTLSYCAPGIHGEMFFSGPGLAKEYEDDEKLTAEKFIYMKPHASEQRLIFCSPEDAGATRYYRSGDVGFFTYDDQNQITLDFVGRTDRNVKMYGVNVNLDAIEASVLTHSDVSEVSVVDIKHSETELTTIFAFVVMKEEMDEEDIKRTLSEHMRSENNILPVPKIGHPIFVPVSCIDTTPNQKTDYHKLRRIAQTLILDEQTSVTSEASIEEIKNYLITLWCQHLALATIDPTATFAELGGESEDLPILDAKINNRLLIADKYAIKIGNGDDCLSPDMTINTLAQTVVERIRLSNESSDQRLQLQDNLRESATHLRSLMK